MKLEVGKDLEYAKCFEKVEAKYNGKPCVIERVYFGRGNYMHNIRAKIVDTKVRHVFFDDLEF